MAQVSTLQSLDLILEDVSAEINLSINALEQYSRSFKNTKALKKSLGHLQKLKGVFTLLEMSGAQRLVVDTSALLKKLPKRKPETRTRLLEVASVAHARLMRYVEHINQKPYDLPQLLLPSINDLRTSINAPLLEESAFFHDDGNKTRGGKKLVLVTSEESATKSRHFRQMYQVGLIEVLRQTNLNGGLRMMQKALRKLDLECPRPNSPNLWWIAEVMLDGYIEEKLALTRSRLKLFSRLDRQIRKVENKAENLLDDNKAEMAALTREMLYLTSISGATSKRAERLFDHFQFKFDDTITDELLRKESEELRGPSDQDYKSIAQSLHEEILRIEKTLTHSQENDHDIDDLKHVRKQMSNLNNLLQILQVDDQSVRLTVAIDLINKAVENNQILNDKDTNILFIVLDSIRKAVNQSELAKYSGRTSPRRQRLSKTEKDIWKKTSADVNQLIKTLTQFVDKNRKVLLLKDCPELIKQISVGFSKLKVKQAEPILSGCSLFLEHYLVKNPHTTSDDALNLFADIIGSLEFYLETLNFTAKPSSRILTFAENSLLHLNRLNKNS
ncbi:hypothetical protein [Aliikangiella coralliicola]|uniref:Scaffold protein FimL second domain-containing protein n=1 Tax=Aliikangiella coralliicola TaxID=2592383 RepID=A0A545UJR2_9GAMM|nr:hypothetical protein [Aliikangiella coralliicola]TQV89698.1 hypothetical protein FLL46_02110 [Aliikangiella coralliicola]